MRKILSISVLAISMATTFTPQASEANVITDWFSGVKQKLQKAWHQVEVRTNFTAASCADPKKFFPGLAKAVTVLQRDHVKQGFSESDAWATLYNALEDIATKNPNCLNTLLMTHCSGPRSATACNATGNMGPVAGGKIMLEAFDQLNQLAEGADPEELESNPRPALGVVKRGMCTMIQMMEQDGKFGDNQKIALSVKKIKPACLEEGLDEKLRELMSQEDEEPEQDDEAPADEVDDE